jgi:uncharacterized protein (TIGR02646 family)
MIFVDRSNEPPPKILSDQILKTGGPQETQRAIEFYKLKLNQGKSFPYKVYSNPEVKAALERLFKHKCAYCETTYMAGNPTDVEHWRPKGEVETEKKQKIKPGYYWLAANWNNLFPSCIECNRRRYQRVGNGKGEPVLLGKQNSFPLADGSPRAARPAEEKDEKPLLLNPCEDKALEYLAFAEEEEKRGVICALPALTPPKKARAEASIEVYALNRVELVHERKKKFLEIQKQCTRVEEAADRVENAMDAATRRRDETVYNREMNDLLAYTAADAPYALMAMQIIANFSKKRLPTNG